MFSGSRQGQSWRFVPAVPVSVWTWYESIKKSGFNIFSGCTKDRGALQAWFLLDPVSRFCVQTAKKQQHFPPEKVLHAVKCIVINRVNKRTDKMSNEKVTTWALFWDKVLQNRKKAGIPATVEECTRLVATQMMKDKAHLDNPQKQIETLCLLTDGLINDNKEGQMNELIGFYGCVARSLKELLRLQAVMKEKQEE